MVAGQSNNIVCIIQARVTSDRLPGKIALDLCGKTILERVVEQCKHVKNKTDIFHRNYKYEKVNLDDTFPKYIIDNSKKFRDWIE